MSYLSFWQTYNILFDMQPDSNSTQHQQIIETKFVLKKNAVVGVYAHERNREQEIEIILRMSSTNSPENIQNVITAYLSTKRPYLLERMALDLCQLITRYCPCESLILTIKKPHALTHARNAYVTIRARARTY